MRERQVERVRELEEDASVCRRAGTLPYPLAFPQGISVRGRTGTFRFAGPPFPHGKGDGLAEADTWGGTTAVSYTHLGVPRFTFGTYDLLQGVSVIPCMIGLFSFSQVLYLIGTDKTFKMCIRDRLWGRRRLSGTRPPTAGRFSMRAICR